MKEIIADQIRQDIIQGTLRLGQQVPERHYAESHRVSRTPVREAILALAAEGLIVIRAQSGSRVISFDRASLHDLFQLRLIHEVGAVWQASEEALVQLVPDLTALYAQMDSPVATAAAGLVYNDVDTRFHTRIVMAAENRLLLERYSSIAMQCLAARTRLNGTQTLAERANTDHRQMIDTLQARDMAGFKDVLSAHFDWVQKAVLASAELAP